MRIAIIEDDKSVASRLVYTLTVEGDTCHLFSDAKSFLHALPRESFDASIVDLMLPGVDGFSLLRAIREKQQTLPALVLTARDAEADVINALEAGADDFVVKPARSGELRARLRALVRRAGSSALNGNVFQYDRFSFDLKTLEVRDGDQPVELTQKEFQLAVLFLRNVGKPLSRGHIREAVWGRNAEVPSRTMDTHVSRVRSKLGLRPDGGYLLAPVYSYGYRLENLRINEGANRPGSAVAPS
ncbi:MAG: response regulator transcription factor [Lautropia sp.]